MIIRSRNEGFVSLQEDFADVHKKLSSLAVSQAHQAPPSHTYSYLPPQLPLLPPHLLQTPPSLPTSHTTIHGQYHEQLQTPPLAYASVAPTTTNQIALEQASPLSQSTRDATVMSTQDPVSNVPGSPLSSQAQPLADFAGSTPQMERDAHSRESTPQYRATISKSDCGKLDTNPVHLSSNLQTNFTSSKLASDEVKFTSSSPSTLAPPPPSLSEALQVPGFDTPPYLSRRQHEANPAYTSSTGAPYSAGSQLASKPTFDVDAFINSLRRNQPQLNENFSKGSPHSCPVAKQSVVQLSPGVQHQTVPLPLSTHSHLLSQSHLAKPVPTTSTTTPSSVADSSGARLPAVDLSVSLLSTIPEEESTILRGAASEGREREGELSTAIESEHVSAQRGGQTSVEERPSGESKGIEAPFPVPPSALWAATTPPPAVPEARRSSGEGGHAGLSQNWYVSRHPQGHHQDGQLKPAWFSLTSHLSHS